MRRYTLLLLLLGFAGCGSIPATPTAPSPTIVPTTPVPVPNTPTPSDAELRAILIRQIREYEPLYYTHRPPTPGTGDWRRTDEALKDWLPQRPEFADYYGWLAVNYRSDATKDAFRSPAVLRANVDEYVTGLPERRATERAQLATRAAPTATATPLPTPAAALGQPVRVDDWEVAVAAWDNWGRRDLPWSANGDVLRTEGAWIVVVVAMTNRAAQPRAVDPADFQVRDAAGRVSAFRDQPGARALSAYRGGSPLGDPVPPGQTGHYFLPFVIAPEPAALYLVYVRDWRPVIRVYP